jgi:hypothetical protein
MIYTSAGWWNANILSSWQCINKLWDANWTTAPVPMIPHGWVDWLFWQYSADGNGLGKKYGSGADGDKDMDLDKFHGNADLFNQLFKVTLPPTPPPPPPAPIDPIVPIKHVIINTGALNMRSLPQANSTDLGTLAMNDDVSVTREANGWYKVEGWISGKLTRGG